jgi:hypothetical protein
VDKRRWQQAAASWRRRLAGEQGENERQRDRGEERTKN